MIYFIQEQKNGNIKIGYTSNVCPDGRLKAIQTGNSDRLVVLATIDGDADMERRLHQQFEADRLAGEWFRPSPAIIQFVLSIPEQKQPKPTLPWPLTIYLAGKISKRDWRISIVQGVDDCDRCAPADVDLPSEWPIIQNVVLGVHHYAGPFFIGCDHGCYHGDDSHGVNAQHMDDACHGQQIRAAETVKLCLDAIDKCDVVFAWIDSPDCYGTITEIGYAKSKGKKIIITGPRYYRDMWFVYKCADVGFPAWSDRTPEKCLELGIDELMGRSSRPDLTGYEFVLEPL